MLYAGSDLSRQRLDVHLMDEDGTEVEVTAVRPDADALRTLVGLVARRCVAHQRAHELAVVLSQRDQYGRKQTLHVVGELDERRARPARPR